MFKTLIVIFAIATAVLAGVPGNREQRQAVYSSLVGAPLAYSASPYAYTGGSYYAGVPTAYSAYSSYPYTASVYDPIPAVRYY